MNSGSLHPLGHVLELAVDRGILSGEHRKRLLHQAGELHIDPTDLAMQQGLLEPTQVEFLDALFSPPRVHPRL